MNSYFNLTLSAKDETVRWRLAASLEKTHWIRKRKGWPACSSVDVTVDNNRVHRYEWSSFKKAWWGHTTWSEKAHNGSLSPLAMAMHADYSAFLHKFVEGVYDQDWAEQHANTTQRGWMSQPYRRAKQVLCSSWTKVVTCLHAVLDIAMTFVPMFGDIPRRRTRFDERKWQQNESWPQEGSQI